MKTQPDHISNSDQSKLKIIGPAKQVRGKKLLKQLLRIVVMPRLMGYRIMQSLIGDARALCAITEHAARITGYKGILTRSVIYKHILDHVGQDVSIGFGTCFSKTNAKLGDRVYIGRNCSIGWVNIENNVHIADGVQILSGRNQHSTQDDRLTLQNITIGQGAWIGAGAIIMTNVGPNAIVGAGSVVVHPVPAGEKVAGNPSRSIGSIAA